MKYTPLCCSVALFLAGISPSRAQTTSYTWTGGTTGDWLTAGNWSPAGGPPNSSTASAIIGTSAGAATATLGATSSGELVTVDGIILGNSGSTPGGLVVENSSILTSDANIALGEAGSSGNLTIQTGGQVNMGGTVKMIVGYQGNGGVVVNGGSLTINNDLLLGGYAAATGTMMVEGGGTVSAGVTDLGNGFFGTGSAIGGTGIVTVTGLGSQFDTTGLAVGGTVGNPGNGTFNLENNGVLDLNSGGGTVELAAVAGYSGVFNIGTDGTTAGTAGTIEAAGINGLAGTSRVNFGQTDSTTFAPILSGSLSLSQTGTGTTTLTKKSTYTGTTTVTKGVLNVTGSLMGTSGTTVTNGTLSGSGTGLAAGTGYIANSVTIGNGTNASGTAILSPHDTSLVTPTVGTLGTGALTLNSDAVLSFYLNTTPTVPTSDKLFVTGNLTLNNAEFSATDLGAGSPSTGSVINLITYTGTESGTFAGLANGSNLTLGSNIYQINYGTGTNSAVSLSEIAAVPEPSTLGLLLGGMASLLLVIRRNKS